MLNASELTAPSLDEWLPLNHRHPRFGVESPSAILALVQATWLQLLLCVVAALPLAWPHLPALTDLGGHLGRFAVQIDGGASASLRQWYSFRWAVIPNLGTDLLMQALAPHFGLEPSLKAIVIAIVVVQAAGFLMLARVVHGYVPPTALLALPLVYGYPFQYGFLNFVLCTALGTWAVALWIALDRPAQSLTRWLVFVPIACALWLCHLEGWALFCVLAAGCELARWRTGGLSWRAAGLRSAMPLSCLLVPCLLFVFGAHGQGDPGETGGWSDPIAKLAMIIMVVRDRWEVWDTASALLLVGVIGWTWRSRAFSRDAGLVLGAIATSVIFVLLPKHVGGTSFVDMRLVPMILAIALIAVRPRDDCPRRMIEGLAVVGLVFFGARMAGNAASLALFDRQFTADLPVLETVPRDMLLVTLTLKPCMHFDPWIHERRTHFAGYALARRHIYANDQWVMAGGQLLRVHAPAAGYFTGDPSQTGSPTACLGKPDAAGMVKRVPLAVRYLWIVENGVARVFPGWHPIRFSPGSVLYTRD